MMEPDNDGPGAAEGQPIRRRQTYSPPPADAEVPINLGETSSDPAPVSPAGDREVAPRVSPSGPESPAIASSAPAVTTPAGWDSSVLTPPIRRSLSDQEIMQQMGRPGSDTAALINALQEQMELRKREDEDFEGWSTLIRQSYPEDEAEAIVSRGTRLFEGEPLDPAPVTPPRDDVAPAPVADNPPAETQTPAPAASEAPVAPTEISSNEVAPPESVESEPIVLPRWGAEQVVAEPVVEEPEADPSEESSSPESTAPLPESGDQLAQPVESFDQVISDPEAVSPPTNAWPLADIADTSAEVSEPDGASWLVEEITEESVSVATDGEVMAVTLESETTVSVHEALRTKEVPEVPLQDLHPETVTRFGFDHIGAEPTSENQRTDRRLQLLWSWFAIGVPVPLVMLGVWLTSTGLNFGQAVVAGGLGVLLAIVPVIVTTVAGGRSGLPTLIASRSAFGRHGNIGPAVFMLLARVAVAVLAVWLAAWMATGVLVESNYWNGDPALMHVILAAVCALAAAGIAIAGRGVVTLSLWVSAGLGLFSLVGLVVFTIDPISRDSLGRPAGDTASVVAGMSVVMSALIVFWAHFGGDIARFVRSRGQAGGASLSAIGAVVPVLILLAWGALLGGSSEEFRQALFSDFFDSVLGQAPLWYPIPALLVAALPLLGIAGLTIHSSGYALLSVGARLPRYAAATIVAGVVAVATIGVVVFVPELGVLLPETALALGVPVAAWVGIVTGDLVTRRRPLDPRALVRAESTYPAWRIAPVLGFVFSLALGWGLVSSDTTVWSWLGYLTEPLGQIGLAGLEQWQLGPLVALTLSLLVSLLAGIRGGVLPQSATRARP